MRFAITHPMHSHPYHPDVVSGAGITAIAAAAEQAGIHGFGFTDHPAPSQRWLEHGGHDALDPFVAMSFAAAHTSRLRLIPNIVVLPYRNPFVVAKAAATLDLLSDGRFTLAVGVGYMRKEFEALGVDYEQRAELFEEALRAIRAAWTTDDLSFEGKHFTARGITAHPRPVAQPHPPIWIAGNTAAARERVVRYGDGWCPFPAPPGLARTAKTAPIDSVERLRALIADLHARLEAAGRDPAAVDVAFSPFYPKGPGDADFNADEFLAGLEELVGAGVTWVNIHIPGDGVRAATEALDRFRATVIEAL
ncbi:LLM class F420-dependent oxidoreductase [[Mycobacterium] wendilense]|uniref:LLM class F420-dependent oxidoreductase n=1 Tax=[Mycobacterium] wendilense TaxID=3064284 RepID=A0ABM9ME76_9MYCO|nr:LLM class F420-dependent oxidoreductase [Mycolicibacterium sp. MU0050]CAJ1582965.1 LLM class F420-dependent oxidoreductase [Mycolicibacterium sp. MU0050]